MATYLLINLVFLAAIALALVRQWRKPSKRLLFTFAALLLMTAVFDSFIVGFGMVAYDPTKILGIYIGNAPVEDFFYAIVAVVLVPTIWGMLGKRHD